MRRRLALAAALVVLALAACGGDDETSSTSTGASGATGATGVETSDLTAEEFIAASIPDQLVAVEDAVAADSNCADIDTSPGGDFQVAIAIDAASAGPDTPLSEIVAENC